MSTLGYHVNFRLIDGRVIAPTAAARRRLARTMLRVGARFDLVSFGAGDTHLHYSALCSRQAAGEATRCVKIGLGRHLNLDAPFDPAHYEPIRDQRHLTNAAYYNWRQEAHHGTSADPLHDASNLSDLVGLRLVGAYTRVNLAKYLPRVTQQSLVQRLGLDLGGEVDCWEQLAEAAAAAACLPALEGRSAAVVEARAAAVQVARGAVPTPQIAELLSLGERAARKLATRPVRAELAEAISLQLRARSSLRRKQLGVDGLSSPG